MGRKRSRSACKCIRCVACGMGLMLGGGDVAGELTGSKHDFADAPWNPHDDSCSVCHVPKSLESGQTPLWNHEVTSESFQMYPSGGTIDGSIDGVPSRVTKLCLSCHDGVTAVDAFGGEDGSMTLRSIDSGGSSIIGLVLGDDHPVSITYTSSVAARDGELHDPSVASSGLGGTIQNDMLVNDQVECTSCHDVHDTKNNPYMLRKPNARSALCLTCH